jgi:hypothetical protein
MQYHFVRLNNKIFLASVILGVIAGFLAVIFLMKGREEFEFILLWLMVVVAIAAIGYQLAKRKYVLDLSHEEYLLFDGKTLYYKDIVGYHKFEDALLGGAFGLLTADLERHNLSSIFSGGKSAQFYEAQEQILEKLKLQKADAKELTYSEYYQKQMTYLRPFLYVIIALVLLADIWFLFWLIPAGHKIPYQFWFMNLALLGVIPLLSKK